MTRVKVCGLTRKRDVTAAVDAGVDAVGAIVDVPVDSPREVAPDAARRLFEDVPPFVTTVLVTMPETVAGATDLVDAVGPDALQVHGGLSPSSVADLGTGVEADVIVAVDATRPESAFAFADVADAVLLDSTDQWGAGGTGRTHDWDRARTLREQLDAPVVLAGGLTPEVVDRAIETVEPYAVDVASGVETSGGVKDHDALADFVTATRGVEA